MSHRLRVAADLRWRGHFLRCFMKIGAIPENLLERLAVFFGLVPTPIIDTFHAVIVARAVMVATKLDIFDALAARPLSAMDLAAQLGLDGAALEKLLNVLVAIGYVQSGPAGFAPARLARKWRSNPPRNSCAPAKLSMSTTSFVMSSGASTSAA